MLQIKTLKHPNPERFDEIVNEALADGWTLTRRLTGPTDFVAELEKNIITEDEKRCENCKHFLTDPTKEPCMGCTSDASNWEAVE